MPTFCFVYDPAPGHSVMMSSLASLFVAKANATPENVVPYNGQTFPSSQGHISVRGDRATYEINADDQLCLASAIPLHLGGRPAV